MRIIVGDSIIENHAHRFMMEYAVYSNQHKKTSSIGSGRIVMLNYANHNKVIGGNGVIN